MKDEQIQLLVFVLNERQYGLRLSQVQRVIRAVDATPLPHAPEIVLGVIDVRGTIIPLLNIRRRFGLKDQEITPDDQFVIAATSRRTIALAVDGIKEIVERPADQVIVLERVLNRSEIVDGAIQLEDGLVLIHDLDRFLSLDEERLMEDALNKQFANAA